MSRTESDLRLASSVERLCPNNAPINYIRPRAVFVRPTFRLKFDQMPQVEYCRGSQEYILFDPGARSAPDFHTVLKSLYRPALW